MHYISMQSKKCPEDQVKVALANILKKMKPLGTNYWSIISKETPARSIVTVLEMI